MCDDKDSVAFILNHIDTNVNAKALSLSIEYDFGPKIYRNVSPIHMACHFGSNILFDRIKVQEGIQLKAQDDCNRSIFHSKTVNMMFIVKY